MTEVSLSWKGGRYLEGDHYRRDTMHINGCNAQDHPRIGRRELLQAGSLSLLGTSLADLLRIEADAAAGPTPRKGKAKSVVFIFQSGGPSQHETFDPKPTPPGASGASTAARRRS